MKKAFSIFAAVLLLLMAGCEKQLTPKAEAPAPIPPSFTAKLEVAFGETTMTANLKKNSANDYFIQILSPEIMSSLGLAYKDDVCTVTYDGLKFETDLNRFPQAEFGALLTGTLTDIEQGIDIETAYADGIRTYRGTGERGVFEVTRNEKTGEWLELSIEGAQLHVKFSEYKTTEK